MRVISGSARGKRLTPVPGMDTRPTTDRVKESIFNIIQMQVRGARVLDLFAGTGQLGIEALSRGAAHADFVDQDRQAVAVVRRNLEATRVADRAAVHEKRYPVFLQQIQKKTYDLVFLDPPYGGILLNAALRAVERFDILAPDGIIICESAMTDELHTDKWSEREYRYGAIKITVLRRAEE